MKLQQRHPFAEKSGGESKSSDLKSGIFKVGQEVPRTLRKKVHVIIVAERATWHPNANFTGHKCGKRKYLKTVY